MSAEKPCSCDIEFTGCNEVSREGIYCKRESDSAPAPRGAMGEALEAMGPGYDLSELLTDVENEIEMIRDGTSINRETTDLLKCCHAVIKSFVGSSVMAVRVGEGGPSKFADLEQWLADTDPLPSDTARDYLGDLLYEVRRLTAEIERLKRPETLCKSCGTITRDDRCDCVTTGHPELRDAVNYTESLNEQCRELSAGRDALKDRVRELEGEVEHWKADALNYSKAYGDAMERSGKHTVDTMAAESKLARAKEALTEIAEHPHCQYHPNQNSAYEIGAADGHRCAAQFALSALASLSCPSQTTSEPQEKRS